MNEPRVLTAKLLFAEKPSVDADAILSELKNHFAKADHPAGDPKAMPFFFPEISGLKLPAQCAVFVTDDNAQLPAEALEQNWHWREAAAVADECKYEITVTDMMARGLDLKTRIEIFMNFLVSVDQSNESAGCVSGQRAKTFKPAMVVEDWRNNDALYTLSNVRMFNIGGGEMLMDILGLAILGLPDFEIRYSKQSGNDIANVFWNYAYRSVEIGVFAGFIIVASNRKEAIPRLGKALRILPF